MHTILLHRKVISLGTPSPIIRGGVFENYHTRKALTTDELAQYGRAVAARVASYFPGILDRARGTADFYMEVLRLITESFSLGTLTKGTLPLTGGFILAFNHPLPFPFLDADFIERKLHEALGVIPFKVVSAVGPFDDHFPNWRAERSIADRIIPVELDGAGQVEQRSGWTASIAIAKFLRDDRGVVVIAPEVWGSVLHDHVLNVPNLEGLVRATKADLVIATVHCGVDPIEGMTDLHVTFSRRLPFSELQTAGAVTAAWANAMNQTFTGADS